MGFDGGKKDQPRNIHLTYWDKITGFGSRKMKGC